MEITPEQVAEVMENLGFYDAWFDRLPQVTSIVDAVIAEEFGEPVYQRLVEGKFWVDCTPHQYEESKKIPTIETRKLYAQKANQ